MNRHEKIDGRNLRMVRAIAEKIDADPLRAGIEHARQVCNRWHTADPRTSSAEWLSILNRPWEEIKQVMLDETDYGNRLRQSDPFCGILSPQERWSFYRKDGHETK